MILFKNIKMIPLCGRRIILSQNNLLKVLKRNGYLVLVPEIGEDLPGKYPLLKEDRSPEFNAITIEKCIAAIGRQTLEFEEAIKTFEKKVENVDNVCPNKLFKNVLNPIEEMRTSLYITWGIAKTLYFGNDSLMPTEYYISIHDRARKAVACQYYSKPIFQACKSIIENKDIKLTNEQRKILMKFILHGKINGLELSENNSEKLCDLALRLNADIKEYAAKMKVAENVFNHTITDPTIVKDFPEGLLKCMVADPLKYDSGPWKVNLNPVISSLFIEFCPDRGLRWKVWDASVTKLSMLGDRSLRASVTLEHIRDKRNHQARLLGYKSYADLSMETKMAADLEEVYSTLDNLLATARPAQEYEIKQLNAFAKERDLEGTLQHWDISYWSRKQLQSICKHKQENIRHYFPLPNVLSGLFVLIEMLFDVKIVETKKPDVWHKDVRFFDVFDLKQSSTKPVGSFYLDLYLRGDEKVRVLQNAGYVVDIRSRSKVSGIKPLVALIFNFQPPRDGEPSLLTLEDLETLFQRFGHMLKEILTTVEYAELAGFANVEWDACLIPDYFLQHWLYEPFVIQQISCHKDTGESLPTEMIETLKTIKTHFSGYNLCMELFLSRIDLELHSREDFWVNIMKRLWKKYFVLPLHKRDCRICSFDAIFSGELAASYYSAIWSKMIAADLYDAFRNIPPENETLLKEVGSRYRETFLYLGGSYSANELFRKFRGRDPSPKAFLKELSLDAKAHMLQATNEKV